MSFLSPENSPESDPDDTAARPFRGWRLLGVIFAVVVVLAAISAIVDWAVLGSLEGRVF